MEPDTSIVVDKTKKPKGSIIAIIILSILAVGGIALGVFGLIQNHQKSEEISRLKETTATGTVVTAPESVEDETTEDIQPKEIEITNGYVLRDLRHKIGVLHGINNTSIDLKDTFSIGQAFSLHARVYTNTLNANQKSSIALKGELKEAISDPDLEDDRYYTKLRDFINSNDLSNWISPNTGLYEIDYISYKKANDLYKQLFGNFATIEKVDITGAPCGQNYYYIPTTNGFTPQPYGCGSASLASVFVKIDSYKAKGNEAYVDLRAASATDHRGNDGEMARESVDLYDGVYYDLRYSPDLPESGSYENGKILGTVGQNDGVDLFGNHVADVIFDKYGDSIKKYRFVFKMNADGTFYFSHVENL